MINHIHILSCRESPRCFRNFLRKFYSFFQKQKHIKKRCNYRHILLVFPTWQPYCKQCRTLLAFSRRTCSTNDSHHPYHRMFSLHGGAERKRGAYWCKVWFVQWIGQEFHLKSCSFWQVTFFVAVGRANVAVQGSHRAVIRALLLDVGYQYTADSADLSSLSSFSTSLF